MTAAICTLISYATTCQAWVDGQAAWHKYVMLLEFLALAGLTLLERKSYNKNLYLLAGTTGCAIHIIFNFLSPVDIKTVLQAVILMMTVCDTLAVLTCQIHYDMSV